MDRPIVRFDRKNGKPFIEELRRRVKGYFEERNKSHYANANMVLKTIAMLALYFVPYSLMVFGVFGSTLGIGLMWGVMGFGMAGVGLCVMHDANHNAYSKNKRVNMILGNLINFIGGHAPSWQVQHNLLHHGYTNIDGLDDDISPGKFLRFSPDQKRFSLHRFQFLYAWFFYSIMTLYWAFGKDFRQIHKYYHQELPVHPTKSYTRLMVELTLVKILYFGLFLVIPMIVLPVSIWVVFGFFVMSHAIAGLSLSMIFQTAHVMPSSEFPSPNEDGHMENNWAVHQMLTTANYAPKSKVFSWMIGGLNYQIEHHLFPNICHVHYPNIAQIVRDTAKEYNLPYNVQSTFADAVLTHTKMLYYLGQRDELPATVRIES